MKNSWYSPTFRPHIINLPNEPSIGDFFHAPWINCGSNYCGDTSHLHCIVSISQLDPNVFDAEYFCQMPGPGARLASAKAKWFPLYGSLAADIYSTQRS